MRITNFCCSWTSGYTFVTAFCFVHDLNCSWTFFWVHRVTNQMPYIKKVVIRLIIFPYTSSSLVAYIAGPHHAVSRRLVLVFPAVRWTVSPWIGVDSSAQALIKDAMPLSRLFGNQTVPRVSSNLFGLASMGCTSILKQSVHRRSS